VKTMNAKEKLPRRKTRTEGTAGGGPGETKLKKTSKVSRPATVNRIKIGKTAPKVQVGGGTDCVQTYGTSWATTI